MRIMVLGDIHGNADWLRFYVYPRAMALGVDKIVQVGDWGYWEHETAGVQFCDEVSRLATVAEIPMYWLRGNHDKTSLLMQRYGQLTDADGFIYVRDNVLFIPDGTLWRWQGRSFRVFGGAYSVDKSWRVRQEQLYHDKLVAKEKYRAAALGRAPAPVPSRAGTLWFPEEEMSDGEMDLLLASNSDQLDFVLSHDKPRCTNPGWNRKDLPLCLPNQDRLQRALLAHNPSYWFHGHLHHHYIQTVAFGAQRPTTVLSLGPDDQAAEQGWLRHHSWALIDMVDVAAPALSYNAVRSGDEAKIELDAYKVNDNRELLARV